MGAAGAGLCGSHCSESPLSALDLDSPHPWFLIKIKTDAERDLLTGNEAFLKEIKGVFRARDCPDEILQRIVFTFQSQETVERDYAGNWYFALR